MQLLLVIPLKQQLEKIMRKMLIYVILILN